MKSSLGMDRTGKELNWVGDSFGSVSMGAGSESGHAKGPVGWPGWT